jgi:hypothetical protein
MSISVLSEADLDAVTGGGRGHHYGRVTLQDADASTVIIMKGRNTITQTSTSTGEGGITVSSNFIGSIAANVVV